MMPTVIDLLDELALDIAQPLMTQFDAITVEQYANQLSMLSWFTDGNDVRHLVESNRESNSAGLRKAFEVHGREEGGHFIYAMRDLKALGYVRMAGPPPSVTAIHNLVDHWDAPHKLGYSAVVETMAGLITSSILTMKERLKLRDDQFTFWALHIEVDSGPDGHGPQQRRAAAEHLTGSQWLGFIEGVFQGGRAWGDMMLEALHTPIYASCSTQLS